MFDNNFKILPKALDAYTQRQKAIAQNIANFDTPNYKRKYVSFENELQKALSDTDNLKLKTTDSRHINNTPSLEKVQAQTLIDKNKSNRNDGNNVDIDIETTEMVQNNLRYTTVSRLMTYVINRYNTAIKR
ncbi:flagellar basal body rod protein FlgB [Tepiditoga spiralis]|uniref:Flagellar basal body rod protein FlgB n=1 Tax=Tepiditoga spiralis TaxID=2108365 RepID=A0A7G1G747_9BACT|nr:flagellar basal body rod protein FlgB [Tepiditoga spiralis]BBE30994.1 flagellar basal body rod protein FlgB [Tepiditoga spiralis]